MVREQSNACAATADRMKCRSIQFAPWLAASCTIRLASCAANQLLRRAQPRPRCLVPRRPLFHRCCLPKQLASRWTCSKCLVPAATASHSSQNRSRLQQHSSAGTCTRSWSRLPRHWLTRCLFISLWCPREQSRYLSIPRIQPEAICS